MALAMALAMAMAMALGGRLVDGERFETGGACGD